MPTFKIDPFEHVWKNAHIWRGEKALIWYQERLDGSFTVITLYDFDNTKRRIFLEVNNHNQKYEHLKSEIETIEKLLMPKKEKED